VTRPLSFSHPFLLGFEQVEEALDRLGRSSGNGYPPYNVEQRRDGRLRITIAVAGFPPEALSAQVEGNQLVVRGRQDDSGEREFLHRGIAARQFQRSFVLAEGIEVTAARLESGLLHIDLHRPNPEPKVRTIAIQTEE